MLNNVKSMLIGMENIANANMDISWSMVNVKNVENQSQHVLQILDSMVLIVYVYLDITQYMRVDVTNAQKVLIGMVINVKVVNMNAHKAMYGIKSKKDASIKKGA